MLRREFGLGLIALGAAGCTTNVDQLIGPDGLPLPQIYEIEPGDEDAPCSTRLYFGSAVTSSKRANQSQGQPGPGLSLLFALHRIYSILLLYSARKRLQQ